jgi:hypothetical protein
VIETGLEGGESRLRTIDIMAWEERAIRGRRRSIMLSKKPRKHSNSFRKLPEKRLQPRLQIENNMVRLLILCRFYRAAGPNDFILQTFARASFELDHSDIGSADEFV